MGLISQEIIDKVKDAANIVDVIKDYVTLTKKGANYFGKCPFHHEKTASMSVSQAKGMFKCFSCGKGGDVIHFIQEVEAVSYPEAIRIVAKRYNIEIPTEELTREDMERVKQRESAFNVLEYAQNIYRKNLTVNSAAQSYLGGRQISEDILDKYGAGYAMPGKTIYESMSNAGYPVNVMEQVGLIGKGERGYYDYFRDRITFPAFNLQGKVIGFHGRVLDSEAKTAKYLNSPETMLFHKGKTFFGLFQARTHIAHLNKVFLVEGQFDVLSFVQGGAVNTIAGSGTALTDEQINLIMKFTDNVTMVYDGDAAGIKAAIRNVENLVAAGMNVRMVPLPDGMDPDDFVKANKEQELPVLLKNREISFVAYLYSKLRSNDEAMEEDCINTIVKIIASCPESTMQVRYIKTLSDLSKVTIDILNSKLRDFRKTVPKKIAEMPSGIYGVEEAKACIDEENEMCILTDDFEYFSDNHGLAPVVYYKGLPSASDIQQLRIVSNYICMNDPEESVTDKRESVDIQVLKELSKSGFTVNVYDKEKDAEISFINYYVGLYAEIIRENNPTIDITDIYLARVAEMISYAPSTTRIRMTKEWASQLHLPNEKALKDILKPFLDKQKNKKTQERERLTEEADLLVIDSEGLPDYVKENEDLMKMYNRFGFYPLYNKKGEPVSYMFKTDGQTHVRVSDFFMEPLLHVYDKEKENNKRVLKLNRLYINKPKYVEWKSSIFANMATFNEMLINEGAFNFENGDIKHFKKIWQYMSYEFQYCRELKVFGQQDEGFFAFSNAIFHEVDGVFRVDNVSKLGVVEHNGDNYYSPAFSEIYAGERKDTYRYAQDRWLVYSEAPKEKQATFEQWADLMDRVYSINDNGKWAIIYAIMCAFRSDIYPIDRLFTALFLIGPTMSGKTQIAVSIRSLYIKPDAPSFNLNSGTDAAFFSVLERFRDVPQIMEEYNDDQISDNKFQGLKSVTYDGDGKQKRKSATGNDIETSQVNAPVILLGQEAPQKDDNALANRVVLCEVPKRDELNTPERRAIFQELKDFEKAGLSHLLFEVLKLRPLFRSKFQIIQRACSRELQQVMSQTSNRSGDLARVINTVSLFCATCKLLEEHAPHLKLPFSYETFRDLAVTKIRSQIETISRTDKLAMFFNAIDFLIDKGTIKMGRDIKIETPGKITLKDGERNLNPATTRVLYLNLSNVHKMYAQSMTGDKPLTLQTLEVNMKSHPAYLGNVSGTRFKWETVQEVAKGNLESDEMGNPIINQDMKRVVTKHQKVTSAMVLNYDILCKHMGIDFERDVQEGPISDFPI